MPLASPLPIDAPAGPAAPSLRPLHRAFGVEIAGLDLRHVTASDARGAILAALRAHRVVLVREQRLDESMQLALAAALGTVVGTARPRGRRSVPDVHHQADSTCTGPPPRLQLYNQQWHADGSWAAQGAPVTVLYAVAADPGSASTAFADMMSAYDALDASTKAAIDSWQAFHHVAHSRMLRYGQPIERRIVDEGAPRPRVGAVLRRRLTALVTELRRPHVRIAVAPPIRLDPPGAAHPVVQIDPASGRRFVHLGDHAWSLAGHDDACGRALVDALNRRIVRADNVYRHQWRRGDLLLYDNRSVLHRRCIDGAEGTRRLLRRCGVWLDD